MTLIAVLRGVVTSLPLKSATTTSAPKPTPVLILARCWRTLPIWPFGDSCSACGLRSLSKRSEIHVACPTFYSPHSVSLGLRRRGCHRVRRATVSRAVLSARAARPDARNTVRQRET